MSQSEGFQVGGARHGGVAVNHVRMWGPVGLVRMGWGRRADERSIGPIPWPGLFEAAPPACGQQIIETAS
jgi:hypothetical protein